MGRPRLSKPSRVLRLRQLPANRRARAPHRLKVALAHQLLVSLSHGPARDAQRGSHGSRRRHALATREPAAHDSRPPELVDLPCQRHGRVAVDANDDGHKWPTAIGGKWLMSGRAALSTMTPV